MGRKQFMVFLLFLPIFSQSEIKLQKNMSDDIISFALYNYDNLIADCYEQYKPYITELSYILSDATKVTESIYYNMLNETDLCEESIPVRYMLLLNKKTKKQSNYYFVDD